MRLHPYYFRPSCFRARDVTRYRADTLVILARRERLADILEALIKMLRTLQSNIRLWNTTSRRGGREARLVGSVSISCSGY